MVTGPPSRSMSPRAVRTRAMHWSRRCWAASIKWEELSARIGCASGRVAGGIVVPVRRRLEFVTVSLEADDLALEVEADLVLLLVLTAQSVIGDPGVVLLHPPGGMPEDLANGAAGDTRVRHPGAECVTELMPAHGGRGTTGVDEVDAAHPGVQAGVDGPVRHRVLAVRIGHDLGEQPSAGPAVPLPETTLLPLDVDNDHPGGRDSPVTLVLALVVDQGPPPCGGFLQAVGVQGEHLADAQALVPADQQQRPGLGVQQRQVLLGLDLLHQVPVSYT